MCERDDFIHIVDRLKFRFFNRLLACNNEAVKVCFSQSKRYDNIVVSLINTAVFLLVTMLIYV